MKKPIFSVIKIILLISLLTVLFVSFHEKKELINPMVKCDLNYQGITEPKSEAMESINLYREQNDLAPLKYNSALYYSALKSAKMIYDGDREWSHVGYDDIMREFYPDYSMIGENLARDFQNEINVFAAWQNSKAHNDNLLHDNACEYGFANYQNVYVLHIGCQKVIEEKTSTQSGKASFYSREGCLGCSPTMTMANGEPLDDSRLTVAYNDAPLNSYVTIKNVKTGQSVTAKVTDTGGFKRHGKIIDLTIATRDALGCGHVCDVKVNHAI